MLGGGAAGAAYIFYGSASLAANIDVGIADIKLIGEDTDDRFGQSVSGARDVNDDGIDDILVGAYRDDDGGNLSGVAFIFYGSLSPASEIDASVADVKLIGEDTDDYFGRSAVSGGGDFNNDGIADILVGARGNNAGGDDAGAAYIFYGGNLASSIDASVADVKLVGEDSTDLFGFSAAGAGDVNNDGIDDILVGATADDSSQGAAYIFYGSASLANSIDASAANVKLVGEDASDVFGSSVSGVVDINNDGIDDILVGAYGDDSSQGAAYIFYGSASLSSSIDASAANVKLVGADTTDVFGFGVSGGGDVNNDGISDVIVGAYLDDDSGRSGSGSVFIFYGSASLASSIDASAANVTLIGEGANDYFGFAVSGGP